MGEVGGTDMVTEPAEGIVPESNSRARVDADGRDLKRVAEIVMVLAAMGQVRGGRDPTAAELGLVAEAREKLAGICESVKPNDLFPKEAAKVVVNDLGLNQSKEDVQSKMGARPRKMTIAEKFLHTKRKIEECKDSAIQSSTCSSPVLSVGFGGKSENRSPMFHGAQRVLPDKQSAMSLSAGGFQSGSPVSHVPAQAPANSLLKPSQVNEMQRTVTPVKSSPSSVERDSSSLTLPRSESAHFRLDARSNMPSYLLAVQATTTGDRLPEKDSTSSSVQSASSSGTKPGQAFKLLDNDKAENACGFNAFQNSSQLMRDQDSKNSLIQATPGSLQVAHQPSYNISYHSEIAKNVKNFLQPNVSDQRNWTPPSTEYMNSPLACQICKITISDVDSLLVCDACEKGTHLKCVMAYNLRGIPKLEWHCQKCLTSSNGKPLPPKYGRVTRSIGASKASPNTGGAQTSSHKRGENLDSKANHQKIANGNPVIQSSSHNLTNGGNYVESTPDMKTPNPREMQGTTSTVTRIKLEECKGSHTDLSKESAATICVPSIVSNESSNCNSLNSGLFPCGTQRTISNTNLEQKVGSDHSPTLQASDSSVEINHQSEDASDSQVSKIAEMSFSVKVSANPLYEVSKHTDEELKGPPELRDPSVYQICSDFRQEDRDNSQATSAGDLDSVDGSRDCCRPLTEGFHSVEWVGDVLQAVDEKSYYQSCRINGEVYNLQDHVLCSSNQICLPSKLQVLWEDNKAGTKWAIVNPYYFPSDLPEEVSRPSTPEENEVYKSSTQMVVLVGSIRGLCNVLPLNKFKEESLRRMPSGGTSTGLPPVFLCRWGYCLSDGFMMNQREVSNPLLINSGNFEDLNLVCASIPSSLFPERILRSGNASNTFVLETQKGKGRR